MSARAASLARVTGRWTTLRRLMHIRLLLRRKVMLLHGVLRGFVERKTTEGVTDPNGEVDKRKTLRT